MQDGILIPKYIEKSGEEIITELKKLRKKISESQYNENEIIKEVENIYRKWNKTDNIWAVIVLHNELDSIETSLVSLKADIETKEYKMAVEEIDKSIFLLKHIYEKEKFCLKNIL